MFYVSNSLFETRSLMEKIQNVLSKSITGNDDIFRYLLFGLKILVYFNCRLCFTITHSLHFN